MGDNPTLGKSLIIRNVKRVCDESCMEHHSHWNATYGEPSRADLLAALDKEWWCDKWMTVGGPECTPDGPHTGEWECHWAVKP